MMSGLKITFSAFLLIAVISMPVTADPDSIIADHNAVSDFDIIPSNWLEKAKELTIHYGHTSHGSQINSGILAIERADTIYSVVIKTSAAKAELPPQENPIALRMYDGNPPETYIAPDDYWDGTDALNRTRAVADTGLFNYSMWSWCGQQSSNSDDDMIRYLDNLNSLESEYPEMRFIYMTGHTDGGSATLEKNNQAVRDYCFENNKVLFDFADIESYDPDGNYYPYTSDDCSWCSDWCDQHPEDCEDLSGSCAHSHPYNCKLKGKAFWWMMARLAGWNGYSDEDPTVDIYSNADEFTTGDTIVITIKVYNTSADPVDMYAAILLGETVYWYPTWNIFPQPVKKNPGTWEQVIANLPLSSDRPIGSYTFFGAITETQTLNLFGLDSVTIVIK